MTMTNLTAELARQHFAYDEQTGVLTWREPRAQRVKVGDVAGAITGQGYRETKFAGRTYSVHRIVWLMHYGELPVMVDHINGSRADNRLANLRAASPSSNGQNQRRARSDNVKAGLIGAAFHKASGKFRARIGMPGGKQRHLGLFSSAQEAHEAYLSAKRQVHSACTI